jgi:hypothetical protein
VAELGGRLGAPVGAVAYVDGAIFTLALAAAQLYWHPDAGAHEVHGAIRDRYAQLGGPTGFLGAPTTDETATPDGAGRYNHFQGGSVYWHPEVGAFEAHGAIRDKWAQFGWEQGLLGYPVTDETTTADGVGRFHHFQRGSIFWHPAVGAFEVHGAIRDRWAALGWERGYLGYPSGDEQDWTEPGTGRIGRFSPFQRGTVVWLPDGDVREYPHEHVLRADLDAETVHGWSEVTFRSNGWVRYRGHLHESGALSHHYVTFFIVQRISELNLDLVLQHIGGVHGTFGIGSRDDDWDQSADWPQARAVWDRIAAGPSYRVSLQVSTGVMEVGEALVTAGLASAGATAVGYILLPM